MARSPVPGPLVLGNAGELKIQWDFGGRKRLNVLHFTGTSTKPVNQANTDSVSSQVKSLFASSGLLILTSRSYAITNCTVRDMSTFDQPHQYAQGVSTVVINGQVVFENGMMTAARPGRVLYGPAYVR